MAVNNLEEEQGLLYEVDTNGRRVLVRSIESGSQTFLRFTNKTSRPVNLWWRDFRGARKFYFRLNPGQFRDVNSYITHPWEFTDADTSERFVVNNNPVYRSPTSLGGMRHRTNWNITVSVRTLRATALLAVAERIPDPASVDELPLPRILAEDLRALVVELTSPPIPPDQ